MRSSCIYIHIACFPPSAHRMYVLASRAFTIYYLPPPNPRISRFYAFSRPCTGILFINQNHPLKLPLELGSHTLIKKEFFFFWFGFGLW